MGVMADERRTFSGWLPPVAPGAPPPAPTPSPAPGPPGPPAAHRSTALWALVLSITALALLLLSLGTLFIVTLPASIAAWTLALRVRDQERATAALWIARIGVFAGVAAAVVFIALLAGGFDFERFRDDMERELEQRRDRPSGGVRVVLEGMWAAIGR
jgi:hypothetical protein